MEFTEGNGCGGALIGLGIAIIGLSAGVAALPAMGLIAIADGISVSAGLLGAGWAGADVFVNCF